MRQECTVEDCAKPRHSGGLCTTHYMRLRNHGDPLAKVRAWGKDPAGSFKARTKRDGDCLVWTGALDNYGYGRIHDGKKTVRAHRWSYEQSVGPIPDGMLIDHICHNPACVLPAHLRLANKAQNMQNLLGPTRVNKSSGYRNVYRDRNRWNAKVYHNGKSHNLGNFDTPEEANEAAIAFRLEHFTHNDADRVTNQ